MSTSAFNVPRGRCTVVLDSTCRVAMVKMVDIGAKKIFSGSGARPSLARARRARVCWVFLLTVKRDTQKERTTKSRKSWGAKAVRVSWAFLLTVKRDTQKERTTVSAAAAAVQHCCCCETQTRTLSGPPSTGASIAMDGGVADTPCYYTGRLALLLLFNTTRTHSGPPSTGATITMVCCCCFPTQRVHTLRTPKHKSHYHNGRRCGRHNPYKHACLLLLLNTTRTHSGPPSTRATITMDGGVAEVLLLSNTTRAT